MTTGSVAWITLDKGQSNFSIDIVKLEKGASLAAYKNTVEISLFRTSSCTFTYLLLLLTPSHPAAFLSLIHFSHETCAVQILYPSLMISRSLCSPPLFIFFDVSKIHYTFANVIGDGSGVIHVSANQNLTVDNGIITSSLRSYENSYMTLPEYTTAARSNVSFIFEGTICGPKELCIFSQLSQREMS